MHLPHDLAVLPLGSYSREIKVYLHKKDVCSSLNHNIKKLKQFKPPSTGTDNRTAVY